jgi:hypothetical protein
MSVIQSEHFVKALLILLDETFDNVHGAYLDKNTSMFETLAGITAEQASVAVGGKCATLAAQVKHVAFYLDIVDKSVRNPGEWKVDWEEIWRTVDVVTPQEWQAIQDELRTSYDKIRALIEFAPDWASEREIGGAIAVVAHTAYHLGEIRQALCVLR